MRGVGRDREITRRKGTKFVWYRALRQRLREGGRERDRERKSVTV